MAELVKKRRRALSLIDFERARRKKGIIGERHRREDEDRGLGENVGRRGSTLTTEGMGDTDILDSG